jgi:hypothetical protein
MILTRRHSLEAHLLRNVYQQGVEAKFGSFIFETGTYNSPGFKGTRSARVDSPIFGTSLGSPDGEQGAHEVYVGADGLLG